jgi:hypothetical protein
VGQERYAIACEEAEKLRAAPGIEAVADDIVEGPAR